ncbi:unnamed protein product [Rhizopus microsporus]
MKNTPKCIMKGWVALSAAALGAYLFSKNYTLNRLKEYTKDNSVTSSGKGDSTANTSDGQLRRSVNRSLS